MGENDNNPSKFERNERNYEYLKNGIQKSKHTFLGLSRKIYNCTFIM